MIKVTKFDGVVVYLNPDMIKQVNVIPDTVVTLSTGDQIYVRESAESLSEQFVAYKRAIRELENEN